MFQGLLRLVQVTVSLHLQHRQEVAAIAEATIVLLSHVQEVKAPIRLLLAVAVVAVHIAVVLRVVVAVLPVEAVAIAAEVAAAVVVDKVALFEITLL